MHTFQAYHEFSRWNHFCSLVRCEPVTCQRWIAELMEARSATTHWYRRPSSFWIHSFLSHSVASLACWDLQTVCFLCASCLFGTCPFSCIGGREFIASLVLEHPSAQSLRRGPWTHFTAWWIWSPGQTSTGQHPWSCSAGLCLSLILCRSSSSDFLPYCFDLPASIENNHPLPWRESPVLTAY